MRAQGPFRTLTGRSPTGQPLLAALATAVIAGGLWLWALLTAAPAAQPLLAWGGGLMVVSLCAAAATAAYQAAAARRLRARIDEISSQSARGEQEVSRLADLTLPAVAKQLRRNPSAEAALAGVPHPASAPVSRLMRSVVRELATTEHRSAAALAARASIESEATRLAEETLPALVSRIREGTPAEVALHSVGAPANASLQALLATVARETETGERKGSAAMSASASAAARIQAQTTRLLADLRDLQHRHSEEGIFGDLLDLDHRISQLGRLADSIALLSGGRSGRRWTKPIAMESILRGAMGRIDAYRRVVLHSTSAAAVAGYAAEGVMHAMAELLDNAAAFSAHNTQVHVYVEEEDAGVVVTIEDGGLGMRKRERRYAEEIVGGPPDLTTLTGTRLGLAVVGRLAAKHGLTVSFRPSSRGGTGVVVMIPRQLIVEPRADAPAPEPALPADAPPSPAAPAGDGGQPPAADDLLPRRRRGQTLAAAVAARPELKPAAADLPARDGAGPAARLAAFRKAGDGARAPSTPPEQDDK